MEPFNRIQNCRWHAVHIGPAWRLGTVFGHPKAISPSNAHFAELRNLSIWASDRDDGNAQSLVTASVSHIEFVFHGADERT